MRSVPDEYKGLASTLLLRLNRQHPGGFQKKRPPEEGSPNRINEPRPESGSHRVTNPPRPELGRHMIDRSTSDPQPQLLLASNRPSGNREAASTERSRPAMPRTGNESLPDRGPYALRRRPVAASRTAPENSIRCIESRWGSIAATSARNGSARIDATS